jgi:hypothetical protein
MVCETIMQSTVCNIVCHSVPVRVEWLMSLLADDRPWRELSSTRRLAKLLLSRRGLPRIRKGGAKPMSAQLSRSDFAAKPRAAVLHKWAPVERPVDGRRARPLGRSKKPQAVGAGVSEQRERRGVGYADRNRSWSVART